MIFNENVMNKDKSSAVVDTVDVAPHEFEFVSFDELLEIIGHRRSLSDTKSEPSAPIPIVPQSDAELCMPTVVVHRSSKTTRTP